QGVDLALKKVWPSAKRRYCSTNLSRNFKKAFPSPLMYILFWRACNATKPYSFKKAMERLRKEGKTHVMKWFADLGQQSKWTKCKFDPNVCCDTNTSNFVESFNFTLGVDRCRPVLTMLEGELYYFINGLQV
ncbi:Baculoviral IAP repeat-containing protein 6, partial [Bienertia sinuspersici]